VRFAALVAASVAAVAPMGGHNHRHNHIPNLVAAENARVGTRAWFGTAATPHAIEGYASAASVAAGDVLELHVSTRPAAHYRIEIFRLGWYGGLGGRRLACLPSCHGGLAGSAQTPLTLAADPGVPAVAHWPVTASIDVKRRWLSGYYEAWFELTSGPQAGRGSATFFIVRAPPRRHSEILIQVPVNTWQAYNDWGGRSLYSRPNEPAGYRVSFDRPYAGGTDAAFRGESAPLGNEIQLIRFLEQNGYDVSYQTDIDTDRRPSSLLSHRLVMTAGHDEYWTKTIRDAFEMARDSGVNLAFIGANVGFWQMRYEDDRRTIVEYRQWKLDPILDPTLKTVPFHGLVPPRPECELRGVGWRKGIGPGRDYTVVGSELGDPWFAGTGFTPMSTLPGLVGGEWDALQPGCNVPTPTVLFHYEGQPSNADAVRYQASSGAFVFSAGSLQFSWGLDDFGGHDPDPRLQRFMRNALSNSPMGLLKDRRLHALRRPHSVTELTHASGSTRSGQNPAR
jgi:N,N-dimethylformamidase beta subunit-like protein